jgi:hypothetical protein
MCVVVWVVSFSFAFWVWAQYNSFALPADMTDYGVICFAIYFFGGVTGLYAARFRTVYNCSVHAIGVCGGWVSVVICYIIAAFDHSALHPNSASQKLKLAIPCALWGLTGLLFTVWAVRYRSAVRASHPPCSAATCINEGACDRPGCKACEATGLRPIVAVQSPDALPLLVSAA